MLIQFAGTVLPGQELPAYFANDGLDSPVSAALLGDAGPYPAYPLTRRVVIDRLFVNVQALDDTPPPGSQFQLLKNGTPIGLPVIFPTFGSGEDEAVLHVGTNRRGVIFEPVTFEHFDTISLEIFGQPFNTSLPLRLSAIAGSPTPFVFGTLVNPPVNVFDAPGGNLIGTVSGTDALVVVQELPGFVAIAVQNVPEAIIASSDFVILPVDTVGVGINVPHLDP